MRHASGTPELLGTLLGLIGFALTACGLAVFVRHALTMHAYAELGSGVARPSVGASGLDTQATATDGQIDWEELCRQNSDIAAWIRVEGTSIDLPVMTARDGDPAFYLSHDFWGNASLEGTPFLDHRCDAHTPHRLVYGHHLTMGGQFSELQKAYEPERFATLGACHWTTPDAGEKVLAPLCSGTADAWDQGIQRFSFDEQMPLSVWLASVTATSTARSSDWESLLAGAASAITLVTCSSDHSHDDARTTVTFVEVASQPP